MRSSDKTAFRNREENSKFNIVLGVVDSMREEKRRDDWEMEILLYNWSYIDVGGSLELQVLLDKMRESQGGVITDRQAISDFVPEGWR
jgi:hypothetical protein